MKKKDIISIVVSLIIIVVALYFGLQIMGVFPKKTQKTAATNNTEKEKTFSGNIDQETLDNINKLTDYGEANLDNIGRKDPFAPIR
jgi:predicted metalloprotease